MWIEEASLSSSWKWFYLFPTSCLWIYLAFASFLLIWKMILFVQDLMRWKVEKSEESPRRNQNCWEEFGEISFVTPFDLGCSSMREDRTFYVEPKILI